MALNLGTITVANASSSGHAMNKATTISTVTAAAVILSGAISGSGTIGGGTSTTLNTTLDAVPAPVSDVTLNTHKITNVLTGTADTDGTNVLQVTNAIATAVAAIPSSTRGSIYQTAAAAGQALTANTYVDLNGTFSSLNLNNLTVSGNTFTNTASGTSYLQVTASVSLVTSVIATPTDATLAICVNGTPIATTITSLVNLVEEIMFISATVAVTNGQTIKLQVKVAGTLATLTNRGATVSIKG